MTNNYAPRVTDLYRKWELSPYRKWDIYRGDNHKHLCTRKRFCKLKVMFSTRQYLLHRSSDFLTLISVRKFQKDGSSNN